MPQPSQPILTAPAAKLSKLPLKELKEPNSASSMEAMTHPHGEPDMQQEVPLVEIYQEGERTPTLA